MADRPNVDNPKGMSRRKSLGVLGVLVGGLGLSAAGVRLGGQKRAEDLGKAIPSKESRNGEPFDLSGFVEDIWKDDSTDIHDYLQTIAPTLEKVLERGKYKFPKGVNAITVSLSSPNDNIWLSLTSDGASSEVLDLASGIRKFQKITPEEFLNKFSSFADKRIDRIIIEEESFTPNQPIENDKVIHGSDLQFAEDVGVAQDDDLFIRRQKTLILATNTGGSILDKKLSDDFIINKPSESGLMVIRNYSKGISNDKKTWVKDDGVFYVDLGEHNDLYINKTYYGSLIKFFNEDEKTLD